MGDNIGGGRDCTELLQNALAMVEVLNEENKRLNRTIGKLVYMLKYPWAIVSIEKTLKSFGLWDAERESLEQIDRMSE